MAALFLRDEDGRVAETRISAVLEKNGQIFVASLFWFDFGNTILSAFRRRRITRDEVLGIESDLASIPIVTDGTPTEMVRGRIREIALDRELSYYHVSYIELALRMDLRLLSFDRRLTSAIDDGRTD